MNALAAVVDLKWSEDRYRAEREAIRATYGESSIEAAAKRDQALASLFYRSGWTQQELAKAEGKGQSWVAYRLRFGRFLAFSANTTAVVIPKSFTEGRFRSYWEQTDKDEDNERKRFGEVAKLIADSHLILRGPSRQGLGREIIAAFGDGKWHELETIVREVDAPEAMVSRVLVDLAKLKNRYRIGLCDSKQRGKATMYRIVRATRHIELDVLMQDLGPIIDGLKAEGKKNVATISPGTVAYLAFQIEQLIEKLAK